MGDFVYRIYLFNKLANLLGKGYSPRLEAAFQIEEALEGFNIAEISSKLGFGDNTEAKLLARYILDQDTTTDVIPAVDAVDKACDAIVFAIGSLAKVGLPPSGIAEAIDVVVNSIMTKVEDPQYDEDGKLLKNAKYVAPEAELQELIDRYLAQED